MAAVCLGVLFIVGPEVVLHRYGFVTRYLDARQIWNRMRFRLFLSWLLLFSSQFVARSLDHHDVWNSSWWFTVSSDAVLVASFPDSIRSPAGYLGLSAAVSCLSSALWMLVCVTVYCVPMSRLPRDPTNDGIDEVVWMLLVGARNYSSTSSDALSQVQ